MGELKLSVIVPAFNEEKLIASSLAAICEGLRGAGFADSEWELRVCDNASTDDTAKIAAHAGAVVVYEAERQIARARNTGAAAASGEWLLFVDADTTPSLELMRATRSLMQAGGCCGGGALVDSRGLTLTTQVLIGGWNTVSRAFGVFCGAFVFCRRTAFTALGGFDSELYAAEELDFSSRLREWGERHGEELIIISDARLNTSMRKLDLYTPCEMLRTLAQAALHPTRIFRSRQFLDHWYDGRR